MTPTTTFSGDCDSKTMYKSIPEARNLGLDGSLENESHLLLGYDRDEQQQLFHYQTASLGVQPGLSYIWKFSIPVSIRSFSLPPYKIALKIRRPRSHRIRVLARLLTLAVVFLTVSILVLLLAVLYGGFPPSYRDARQKERELPQHHWNQNTAAGSSRAFSTSDRNEIEDDGMYLRFSDHLWGHGLNNVLQETLLYALISHHSNRSFVFEDFVWSHLPFPYTLYDFSLRPTRVPMSAFLGGWIVGGNSALEVPNRFRDFDHQVYVDEEDGKREAEREREESQRTDGPEGFPNDHAPFGSCGNEITVGCSPSPSRAHSPDDFRLRRARNAAFADSIDKSLSHPALKSASGRPSKNTNFNVGSNVPRKWTSNQTFPRKRAQKDTFNESGMTFRRSVSAEYFEHVCPPGRRLEIAYTWPSSSTVTSGPPGTESWRKSREESSNFSVQKKNTGDSLRPAQTPAAALGSDASRSSSYSSHLLALLPSPSATADGVHILEWWVERLSRDDVKAAKCVVVRELERRIWDSDFFGSSRILSLLPLLQDSPVLRKFEWSPLVNGAVERSVSRLFRPSAQVRQSSVPVIPDFSSALAKGAVNRILANDSIPGVLAVHLRRGDYKRHCVRLANWGAGYMGWNRLVDDQAEDRVDFKAGLTAFLTYDTQGSSHNISANDQKRKDAYYLAHCLPTIPQIVSRLRQVRATYNPALLPSSSSSTSRKQHHTLSQVYVLTNGWPSFVAELRTALLADGWERVVASVDLEDDDVDALIPGSQDMKLVSEQRKAIGLSMEEMGVSAAIDMGLAERAEVFVGNGFSSLSANVVMLRIAKGLPIHSNRLL